MTEPIFLDANIFMYAAGKPHAYKQPCQKILQAVETIRDIVSGKLAAAASGAGGKGKLVDAFPVGHVLRVKP